LQELAAERKIAATAVDGEADLEATITRYNGLGPAR
jgi:hypothetical protein